VVANTRKILDTTASDKNDRVFLQIVAFTWNVGGYLHPICQADTGDLSES
jgi:hypothetical protein